ncbi:MAG: carbon-nitrogen hydrolase family protein [Lentisphaerae bacterium]|nr:carbon-nitrogen hydrolase family protein [Lentisphaerota bacterium]
MRIGHYQAVCKPGDFEANLAKVVEGLKRAKHERIEILCFPECFLTGYYSTESSSRRTGFAVDSSKMRKVLSHTNRFDTTLIVGFNELRGKHLYNTALVARRGKLLGTYSKCSAYMKFHTQGRDFPVFSRDGITFGVVICSDGGYIEPTRILALKGARIVFAPHYNYIGKEGLINHFLKVRADHVARAVENSIWFVRGNQVTIGRDKGLDSDGVGYGDSYIIEPDGEIIVCSRRHQEDFIFADVDAKVIDKARTIGRSQWSAREFGKLLIEVAAQKPNTDGTSRRAHRTHLESKV